MSLCQGRFAIAPRMSTMRASAKKPTLDWIAV